MKIKINILILILLTGSVLSAANYHGSGRHAYVYRNFDKAREYFLLDVKDNPDRGDSYYFLGEIEKSLKNYEEALKYFEICVTKRTTRKYLINAYWNIIILYEEKGDFNNLVHYCRELWQKTGDRSAKTKIESIINKLLWTDNELAVQKYNEAVELSKKKDREGALRLYREAVSIDGSFLAPRFEIGISAYNSGDEREALYQLSMIGSRIPFYSEVQLILGSLNLKNKNYSAAAENFNSVINYGFISSSTKFDSLLKRGTCYYYMGNYDQAEKDITTAESYIKNDPDPLIILSAIYIKKKELDSALNILRKAESISPDNSIILFQSGSIYYYRDDNRYISYFDRLFNKSRISDDQVKQYLKAFKILLSEHYRKKNYSRSFEISEAINKVERDYEVLNIHAISSYRVNEYGKAVESFEKISLSGDTKIMLASSYAHIDNKQRAMEILKSIYDIEAYRKEALKDPYLKPLLTEIENERENQKEKELERERLRQESIMRQNNSDEGKTPPPDNQ